MILQGKLLTWLLPPLPGSSQLFWFSFLGSSKIKALVCFCCVIPQGLCTYGASFSPMDSWVSFKVLVRCCLFPEVLYYPPTLLSPKKLLPSLYLLFFCTLSAFLRAHVSLSPGVMSIARSCSLRAETGLLALYPKLAQGLAHDGGRVSVCLL